MWSQPGLVWFTFGAQHLTVRNSVHLAHHWVSSTGRMLDVRLTSEGIGPSALRTVGASLNGDGHFRRSQTHFGNGTSKFPSGYVLICGHQYFLLHQGIYISCCLHKFNQGPALEVHTFSWYRIPYCL